MKRVKIKFCFNLVCLYKFAYGTFYFAFKRNFYIIPGLQRFKRCSLFSEFYPVNEKGTFILLAEICVKHVIYI